MPNIVFAKVYFKNIYAFLLVVLLLVFFHIQNELFFSTAVARSVDRETASVRIQIAKQVVTCRLIDGYTHFDLVSGEQHEFRLLAKRADSANSAYSKHDSSQTLSRFKRASDTRGLDRAELADLFKFLYNSRVVLIDVHVLRNPKLVYKLKLDLQSRLNAIKTKC